MCTVPDSDVRIGGGGKKQIGMRSLGELVCLVEQHCLFQIAFLMSESGALQGSRGSVHLWNECYIRSNILTVMYIPWLMVEILKIIFSAYLVINDGLPPQLDASLLLLTRLQDRQPVLIFLNRSLWTCPQERQELQVHR
jgi:hypothetical protein